jgi:hypothetical protein
MYDSGKRDVYARLLKLLPRTPSISYIEELWVLHWHSFVTQVQPSGAVYRSCFVRTEGGCCLIVDGLLPFTIKRCWFSWQNFTHSWSLTTSWFCYLFTSSKSTRLPSWFDLFACSVLHYWREGLPRRQNSWHTWALCFQWILVVMDDCPSFTVVLKSVVLLCCYVGLTKWKKVFGIL